MSEDIAISVQNVSKAYRIWNSPASRLLSPAWKTAADFFEKNSATAAKLHTKAGSHYRDFWALKEISFEVKKGESIGVIGRNGSGKSTLLQIIAGTLQPTSGTVNVNGRVAALLELGSGFNPEFTGRENVYLNGTVLGLSRSEIDARFDAIAAFADIGDFIEQPVKTYSSGMTMRLAFAVIAHIDATILIIDEALSVGDVYFSQKCMRFLHKFRETGTLLFVSHDMGSTRALCERAVWLDQGSARQIGTAQTVASAYLAESNLTQNNADIVHAVSDLDRKSISLIQPGSTGSAWTLPKPIVANPLTITPFNALSASFGDMRAKITDVRFTGTEDEPLSTVNGGDVVTLVISAIVIDPTAQIILGFNFKDRLGQYLLGENTVCGINEKAIDGLSGDKVEARFTFQLPILHRGQYSIIAALASGTRDNHRQQHWLHEAITLTSATEWAHAGLLGIPMLNIQVTKTAS
jgi:lipopolysaccharide transport system ATP-binding protein